MAYNLNICVISVLQRIVTWGGYSYTWASFVVMIPTCEICDPSESLFYTSNQSDWPPLSAEKIDLSLSYLVPEISEPKLGLIFHQNELFNSF